jgi:hypothetical protein
MMLTGFAFALAIQSAPAPNGDGKSEDSIIKALYQVISGPAEEKRNWDRFRGLFGPKATLSALVKNQEGKMVCVIMTPEDYITRSGPWLEKNGFFEKETKRRFQKTGNLVNVMSDYESRKLAEDKKPFEKGTNSLQLYFDGTRWFIHTVLWEGA